MFFLRKSSPFLLMIAVAAAAWRWHLTGRILEYDEIWTLENFSRLDLREIFSNFATPNNHPFNTLWVKISHDWSANHWDLRLGSLLLSCGAMIFGGLTARRIYGKCAGLYTMAAMAFLPPFLAAGSTARGYAGQLFLLTFFAYALLRCRKGEILWTLGAAVSAVAATVALPSSILFLAPVGGFFLGTMLEKRKLRRVHLYAFGAAVIFALWWYAKNWQMFLETQKFAVHLDSRRDVFNWLYDVLTANGVLLPVIMLTVFLKRKKLMTWALLLALVFPCLAAYASGAAPARVYLPCAAAAAILCAPAAKHFRKSWFILALAGQFFISFPAYPGDRVLENAVKNVSATTLPVFTPTDSYIIRHNYPDFCRRIPDNMRDMERKQNITIALIKSPGEVSGIDGEYNTVTWKLPQAPAERSGITALHLKRNHILPPGEIGFIILPPMIKNNINWAFQWLRGMEILNLNGWMSVPLSGQHGEGLFYMILAVRSPKPKILPKIIPLYTISD